MSQADVERLVKDVEEFVLASHLHWSLWGIMSVSTNLVNHFTTVAPHSDIHEGMLVGVYLRVTAMHFLSEFRSSVFYTCC